MGNLSGSTWSGLGWEPVAGLSGWPDGFGGGGGDDDDDDDG